MRVAVIDIGSNSVRLLIPDGNKLCEKKIISTALAEGLVKTGFLSGESMARTADAVAFFYDKAKKSGCERVFVFATAAVRNSKNGGDFCALLRRIDIDVEVLSAAVEAKLGYMGANIASNATVFDIGGASTEIVKGCCGNVQYSKSVPLGMVVLSDLCGKDKNAIEATVAKYLELFSDSLELPASPLYGIGGTATSLSAMAQNLSVYDVNKTHKSYISIQRLNELEKIVFDDCKTDENKIMGLFPTLSFKRAGIIPHGIIMTKAILNLFSLSGFCALETDNMEGYLMMRL